MVDDKVPSAQSAFERSVSPRASIFAIVDAAREPAGPHQMEEAGVVHVSLFDGELGDMLKDAAPHLAEFPGESPFRTWWFEQWGNSIGVLVEAPLTLGAVRRHLRTLTMVRDSTGQRHFFRFYDPRVLRVFLPACTSEELQRVFGPLRAFYCESNEGELLTFTLDRGGNLQTRNTPLERSVTA